MPGVWRRMMSDFPSLRDVAKQFDSVPLLLGIGGSFVGTCAAAIREVQRSKAAKRREIEFRKVLADDLKKLKAQQAKMAAEGLDPSSDAAGLPSVGSRSSLGRSGSASSLQKSGSRGSLRGSRGDLKQSGSRGQLSKSGSAARLAEKEEQAENSRSKKAKAPKGALDRVFLRRLRAIWRIIVPRLNSRVVFLLLVQSMLLFTRSYLSVQTTKTAALAYKCVIERSPKHFWIIFTTFVLTGGCASVVNSGLKFLTNAITVAVRQRLTRYVHSRYMANRNYYKAAVLRTGKIDNPDQRIVDDVLKFSETLSDLYARTFKPALDLTICTTTLAQNLGGHGGLFIIYSYFFAAAGFVRAVSPNFSRMIARRAQIEGDFRRGHTRIINHAEEIAFLEGENLEREILDKSLEQVGDYSSRFFLKQFLMGCVDQWMFKYGASAFSLPLVLFPFMFSKQYSTTSAGDAAFAYQQVYSMIQAASGALADLMLVYKKFQKLSGYTARVMGLLEAIDGKQVAEPGESREEEQGDLIGFDRVTVYSPDGRLLLKNLSMDIKQGVSVMITGINGAGKTSLFRVLSGLWRGHGGTIVRPRGFIGQGRASLFYMPQSPYLVTGTLRDQVTYPLRSSGRANDSKIREALRRVGLRKFLTGKNPLEKSYHDWADVLSGGEMQRVGWARLFYHRPRFAILDEATSAINPDEEGQLYQQLVEIGVTFFSIAHRLDLRRFHKKELRLAGDGTGQWDLTDIDVNEGQ